MPQPHSFTSPRLLVTIPSHFLHLPPKTLHARKFLNLTASPLQDFLLDSKSFSTPPPQNLTWKSMSQLHSLPSPRRLVLESKSFSKPPPQNLTCKSMPQLHSFTSPSLLVTSPSHFLNLPPPKPYMQEYASTSQLHLSKTSCHDSKSFSNPPQNPTCKSIPQLHSLPYPRLLVTIPSHFLNLPPKTLHERVCLNFTASPHHDVLC